MATAVNNLYASRIRLNQQQQLLRSGNINESNISLFENTEGLTPGMIDGSCTDGKDDGKIGLWEGIKSFGKGAVKSVANMLTPKNILKGIAIGVGIAALNVLLPGVGTAITGALIAGGIVKGGLQLGKGVFDAANANTDAEKRAALENAGEGTATLAASVVAAKGFKNATGKSVFDGSMYKDAAATTLKTAGKGFGKLAQSARPSAIKSSINNELSMIKDNMELTGDQQAFLDLMKENPTSAMKEFGNEFAPGIAKSAAKGMQKVSVAKLNQAKTFISSAKANMSVNQMVSKLNEMGISKADAMTLIGSTAVGVNANSTVPSANGLTPAEIAAIKNNFSFEG